MKHVFFVLLFISFFYSPLFSQKMKIEERADNLKQEIRNSMQIMIPGVDEITIQKHWKSLMKENEGKVSFTGDIVFADDVLIKNLSLNRIDVYIKTVKKTDGTLLQIFIDLGGIFLSSSTHSKEYQHAENFIYDFAISVRKETLSEELKEAERQLSRLEKQLEQLKTTKQSLHQDIERYKQMILDAENMISQNTKDQESSQSGIESQKNLIQDIKDRIVKIE